MQLIACIVICFGMSSPGFFINILGYLTEEPDYACTFNGNGISEDVCTVENICSEDSRIASWQATEESIKNWHIRLRLMCEPSWKVSVLSSSFFLGWCSTLLWLPRISDIYGR